MRDVSRRVLAAGAALFVAFASESSSRAQDPELKAVKGWVHAAAVEQAAMAGAVIENTSAYVVYVTAAESDLAGGIELRDASKRAAAGQAVKFLPVPAFGSLTLSPTGPHLVLRNLKRAIKAGDRVSFTLRTDRGVRIPVTATAGRGAGKGP